MKKFSDKDFAFGDLIEGMLCNVDVRSDKYKVFEFAQNHNNINMTIKYGRTFYKEYELREKKPQRGEEGENDE